MKVQQYRLRRQEPPQGLDITALLADMRHESRVQAEYTPDGRKAPVAG